MKLPVLHNLDAIKGEVISLSIGYNNVVASESLFACVRKYSPDEENIKQGSILTCLPTS